MDEVETKIVEILKKNMREPPESITMDTPLSELDIESLDLAVIVGAVFTAAMLSGFETELYRIPFAVSRSTFGWTAVIVIATAVVSALMVRSRIDQLDLIAVLKTRE